MLPSSAPLVLSIAPAVLTLASATPQLGSDHAEALPTARYEIDLSTSASTDSAPTRVIEYVSPLSGTLFAFACSTGEVSLSIENDRSSASCSRLPPSASVPNVELGVIAGTTNRIVVKAATHSASPTVHVNLFVEASSEESSAFADELSKRITVAAQQLGEGSDRPARQRLLSLQEELQAFERWTFSAACVREAKRLALLLDRVDEFAASLSLFQPALDFELHVMPAWSSVPWNTMANLGLVMQAGGLNEASEAVLRQAIVGLEATKDTEPDRDPTNFRRSLELACSAKAGISSPCRSRSKSSLKSKPSSDRTTYRPSKRRATWRLP